MVIDGVISGTLEVLGDGTSKQKSKNSVLLGVCLCLIKGQDDEVVFHEVSVVEEGDRKL